MTGNRYRAVFARGGTSKAIVFKAADLPSDRAARDAIFLRALGSPDPYGRQLDGLGGGISSLSKIVIVEPSARADADVDYTFAQVAVDAPVVDYASTCGNMSSAVGPFAVDEELVPVRNGDVTVRVFNTNTAKLYHATFRVRDGRTLEAGDFAIPGVSGRGAKVQLDYLDPGGAATGRFLPTGNVIDQLSGSAFGTVDASLVDATNPVVIVAASAIGLTATELPASLDGDSAAMARLDEIRRAGGVAMGLAATPGLVPLSNPKIAIVAPPAAFTALDGRTYLDADMTLSARMISMEKTHRALPLTGAMCLAAAARIEGSIAHRFACAPRDGSGTDLLIANPSGILPVDAAVSRLADGGWYAERTTVYRTQRRLMEGVIVV